MTKARPRNMAASVRQRLMNIARQQREPFDLVLLRYALERLLYRLSQTTHSDRFVLKGAMLFQIWSGQIHRPTRDLDLLGQGSPSPTEFDIGFGDAVTPEPDEIVYPTLLGFPVPTLQAYPRETVVAEKFQAMVMLGIANSRMKDFYDVWTLARGFEFSGSILCRAIRATFDRRRTALPSGSPLAFTVEFTEDDQKLKQWNAFVRKGKLDAEGLTLTAITKDLEAFLVPPTVAIVQGENFDGRWLPGGPWKP